MAGAPVRSRDAYSLDRPDTQKEPVTVISFEDLALVEPIRRALNEEGYTQPTPIQEQAIPELLGGPDTPMIGRVLWTEFFSNRDWPVAAALSVSLSLLLVVPVAVLQHLLAPRARPARPAP